MPTGEVELRATALEVLNRAETPPFPIEDGVKASEDLRLKYRYLDLRRPEMTANLVKRSDVTFRIRQVLHEEGFLEVETPILTKSTPEGARDFLVPSRVHPGEFYALPQSPQLFKQLLMVAGVERYYQIARCFRDEDLRADRQPEFTQVDLELSFPDEETVYALIEKIFAAVFPAYGIPCPARFPRMTYAEAMERFGIDRPDTRYGLELKTLDFSASPSEILRSAERVKGIAIPGGAAFARKRLDDLEVAAKQLGASGLVWVKLQADLPGGWNSNAQEAPRRRDGRRGARGARGRRRRPPPRRGREGVDRQRRPREPPRPARARGEADSRGALRLPLGDGLPAPRVARGGRAAGTRCTTRSRRPGRRTCRSSIPIPGRSTPGPTTSS